MFPEWPLKKAIFSPTRPRCAKTHLSVGEAAGSGNACWL